MSFSFKRLVDEDLLAFDDLSGLMGVEAVRSERWLFVCPHDDDVAVGDVVACEGRPDGQVGGGDRTGMLQPSAKSSRATDRARTAAFLTSCTPLRAGSSTERSRSNSWQ